MRIHQLWHTSRNRLIMAAAALAVVVFAGSAQAATVHLDFGVVPIGGSPGYTGTSLDQSTAFDFGGGTYVVNQIGSGDQSTLAFNDPVTLTNFIYGAGNSGALTSNLIKTWDTGTGLFTETLTSFVADRSIANALTLVLSGTLSGPGGISQAAFAILSANQVAGPGGGNAVNWTLTNTSFNPSNVPIPAAFSLFATGLAGLALLGRRRKRKATTRVA